VKNFDLTDKLGQPNAAGEGHIHYFMDVDPATTPGQPAVTAPGTYAATADTSYTWNNVGGGQHKFSAELVNNNHTPLNPPVIASQTILIVPEIGPPSAVILTPRDNGVVDGNSITVTVQVVNFNLVDKLGQANAPREGHIHYFLDVDAPTAQGQPAVTAPGTYAASAATSYTWQNVAPGTHTLSIELINNDHTPLETPVVSKIAVKVNPTNPASTPASSPSATPTSAGQSVTIDLAAQNMAFDKTSISVPAGADITVNFNNQDGGIPHNFSVYQTLAGGQTSQVFIGQVITGPSTITYHFKAPTAPGDYFFVCDVHPQMMTGKFVITQ
jgi:plastocyanin